MYKLFCFLVRDFLVQVSYRFRFFMNLFGILAAVFLFFFLGETFRSGFSRYLDRYGNDYFAFALLGMCVSTFVSTGLYSLSAEVRGAQMQGTLEILLSTPTPANLVLFGNSMWSFAASFFQSALYLFLTVLIVGIKAGIAEILLVLFVLGLTFVCFLSLGMISAAFIMVFKQGSPVNLLFGTSSYFLGGLLFPVEVLPLPLQKISVLLPMAHAARAVREILLVPAGSGEWQPSLVYLSSFALVLLPAGILFLNIALSRAKMEGSLVQF